MKLYAWRSHGGRGKPCLLPMPGLVCQYRLDQIVDWPLSRFQFTVTAHVRVAKAWKSCWRLRGDEMLDEHMLPFIKLQLLSQLNMMLEPISWRIFSFDLDRLGALFARNRPRELYTRVDCLVRRRRIKI